MARLRERVQGPTAFLPFDGLALLLQPDNDKLIGTILDNKYRIEEKIGEGGMGRVYRATHIHMDHTVAVKILHLRLSSDQTALERFRREERRLSFTTPMPLPSLISASR
jgi:serine/threonine protein kinase